MKQNQFYFMNEALKNGQPIVLATIYQRSGSSPRGAGAFMALTADGNMAGTIGGGKLEAEVREKMDQVLLNHFPQKINFYLSETEAADLDMICGGNVSVLVEPIFPEDTKLSEMMTAIHETAQTHGCGWLVTAVPEELSTPVLKGFISTTGQVFGNLPINAVTAEQRLVSLAVDRIGDIPIKTDQINRQPCLVTVDGQEFFIQPVGQFSKVFLIGGGHIAQKLALLTRSVGFFTTVLDDRVDYLSEERFPLVDERVVLDDFSSVFARTTMDEDCYLVIVTRGHSSDKAVLKQALETKAGYIGMIGSRRKIKATFDLLKNEGVSEANLSRVFTPIGLDIGAETPEEIAISIMAELIQVRARGRN